MDYAIEWIKWEETGFDPKLSPWKNPYEMKKHTPVFYERAKEVLAEQSQ